LVQVLGVILAIMSIAGNSSLSNVENVNTTDLRNQTGANIVPPAQPLPKEMTYSVIICAITLPLLIFIFKNKHLAGFTRKYYFSRQKGTPRIISGYKADSYEKLTAIGSQVGNNLRNLVTIYGILLAFVVSSKLSIAFQSYTFTIWAGWSLAVMVRAAHHGYLISDVLAKEADIEKTKSEIHRGNLFYKHSVYIFVVLIALTPIFFFVVEPAPNAIMPFDMRVSIASVAAAIGAICAAFVLIFRISQSDSVSSIYQNLALFLGSFLLGSVVESPLTPYNAVFFGNEIVIPSIAYWLLTMGMLAGVATTGVFYGFSIFEYFRQKIKKSTPTPSG
jgi:hypothetical protein